MVSWWVKAPLSNNTPIIFSAKIVRAKLAGIASSKPISRAVFCNLLAFSNSHVLIFLEIFGNKATLIAIPIVASGN